MIAIQRRYTTAGALSLALLGGVAGCNSGAPAEPAPPPEPARTVKQALGTGLPVREFVQLPDLCPGSVNDFDTFSSGAALFGTAFADGKVSLGVREPGGATSPVTGADWYVSAPSTIDIPGYRVACSTRASLIARGPGPVGQVYSLDKTQGTSIVCWYNPAGTTTWTEKVVAASAPGEPKDAFWPIVYAPAKVGGAPVANAFEVVYVRDAEYAQWVRVAVGRASREGVFFARVHIDTGAVEIFDQDTYPDWRVEANGMLGPINCFDHCGWQTNGVTWAKCGGCGSGQFCNDGTCSDTPCTPLTKAEVCVDKDGAQACGLRSDGCGGQIQCDACPSGKACGAAGDPEMCGSRPAPITAEKLAALYEDKQQRLCGTLLDPDTGVDVTITSDCTSCVDNLCMDTPLPSCIPSGGLAGFSP